MATNNIGCRAGRVKIIDPNDFDGFNSSDNVPVSLEDLNISVALTSIKKGKTVLTKTNSGGSAQSTKSIKVNFIEGSNIGGDGKKYLTTKWTDLTTDFGDEINDETLGITSIDIEFNSAYAPLITINFVDVRGSSIFQNEERIINSENKFTTFFQLPYPLFELEIKGFYGYPVKYCLHMYKFNSKFNSKNGNFEITCNFVGYTYAMLSDMLLGYLKAIGETELGKERYLNYNNGKSVPVLTLNELAENASTISNKLDKTVEEKGGNFNDTKLAIDSLDNIINEINTLGSAIDLNNGKSDFKYIVVKKGDISNAFNTKKIEDYQDKVYKKGDAECLVLKYNGLSPTDILTENEFVFVKSNTGNGNRVYQGLSINILEKSSESTLKSILGNYSDTKEKADEIVDYLRKNNKDLKEKEEFDLIDMTLIVKTINEKKSNTFRRQDDEKKKLADVFRQEVKTELGFDPTVRTLVECFTAAIEVLAECIFTVADNTKTNTKRTDELKKVFNFDSGESKNTDIKRRFLTSNDFLPWPAYQEKDENKNTFVEKYLGVNGVLQNPSDVNEISFIDELLVAFRKTQKKDEENQNNLEQNDISSWFAINPMDLKEYSTDKPYLRIAPQTSDDVNALLLTRAMTFLAYTNNHTMLSKDEIKLMAKAEAEAMIKDVQDNSNNTLKRSLTTLTVDNIVASQATLNGSKRPIIVKESEVYKYNYLYKDNPLKIIPINKGIINEASWGYYNVNDNKKTKAELKNKQENGFVFLTNYSNTNDTNIYKADDGGVYLKIISPTEISMGSLPTLEIADTENTIKLEGLKNEDLKNPSEAGFNSFGSGFGIQEYVNLNWGVNELEGLPLRYVFYTNIQDDISGFPNEKIGVGLCYNKEYTYEKLTKVKDKSTINVYSYYVNRKLQAINDLYKIKERKEQGWLDSFLGRADGSQIIHADLGKNLQLFNSNETDKITYPFVYYIDGDKPISLFGSSYYYYLDNSKIKNTNVGKYAKAMAFLHTLPFNLDSDNLDPFAKPSIINLFKHKGGIIHAPKLWCAFVGSIIWRNSKRDPVFEGDDIVGGGSGSSDPIAFINYLDAPNRNQYLPRKFGETSDIGKSDLINTLPIQVKDEFIKIFLNFVNGAGTNDWDEIRSKLEIFDGNYTKFKKFVTDVYNKKDLTIDYILNYGDVNVQNINNYYYVVTTEGDCLLCNKENDLWLELRDNTDATKTIIDALNEEVIILNNNYKIWVDNVGGKNEYESITIKTDVLEDYLDEVVATLAANKDNFNQTKETERLNQKVFGTTNEDQIKLSLYRTCKNIYDKWLAGANSVDELMFQCGSRSIIDTELSKKYGNSRPRLIDSFRFVSRAFSDIGDLLYIDPTPINDWMYENNNMSSYECITSLLAANNFEFIPLPNFINFNNEENLKSIFKPYSYSEGTLKDGTCGPSFVSVYLGQNSQHLDYYDNESPNDGFDLRCDKNRNVSANVPNDFTSVSNQTYEEAVGSFLVRYGQQNQNIFKDINLDQSEFTETDESLQIQDDIAQKGRENNRSIVGQNIYNVYSVRSYTAEVEMMGNAMIQPMMYFQLDNIPMFHGAYMITSVNHSIIPNSMTTRFKGVRVKYTQTPLITSRDIYMNLLNSIDTSAAKSNEGTGGTGGSGGGGGGGNYKGKYSPMVAVLIENGVHNGYIEFGKQYGSITTKAVTGGKKKYFKVSKPDYMIKEAAEALDAMADAWGTWMEQQGFKKGSDGYYGLLGSKYRGFETQKNLKSKIKAKAGTSYHGWGLAVDMRWVNKEGKEISMNYDTGSGKNEFDFDKNPAIKWLYENSFRYGFINPCWAHDGGSYDESWHWEYHGKAAICLAKSCNSIFKTKVTFNVPDDAKYESVVKNPKKSDGSENVFDTTSCKNVEVNKSDGSDNNTTDKVKVSEADTKQFFIDVLTYLGAPLSAGNLALFQAWNQWEGGQFTWNPLNTKKPLTNAIKGSDGVYNYATQKDGVKATAETIKNYSAILAALKKGLQTQKDAYNLAVEEQKKCKNFSIWVQGTEGCKSKAGIPADTYVARILSQSKIPWKPLYQYKEKTNENNKNNTKKSNPKKPYGVIIYGGIAPYGAKWIEGEFKKAAIDTTNVKIVFEEYNGRTVEEIVAKGDANYGTICGFSAGGTKIWPYVGKNAPIKISNIALIDPSTNDKNVKQCEENLRNSTINYAMWFNPGNWGGKYKVIGDRLRKIQNGLDDNNSPMSENRFIFRAVKLGHTQMVLAFFEEYTHYFRDLGG